MRELETLATFKNQESRLTFQLSKFSCPFPQLLIGDHIFKCQIQFCSKLETSTQLSLVTAYLGGLDGP